MKIIFDQTGDFEAIGTAEAWCKKNGYSVGSMQRDAPMGVMKGDICIAKWRNLSAKDRSRLNGEITGDKRNGPVTLEIFEAKI